MELAGTRVAAAKKPSVSPVSTARLSRACHTAGSPGMRVEQPSSQADASAKCPVRMARLARPSQTRSSSLSAASREHFKSSTGFAV